MSKESALWIGTLVFSMLGIAAAIVFWIYVGMRSPPAMKSANRKYVHSLWIVLPWYLCSLLR